MIARPPGSRLLLRAAPRWATPRPRVAAACCFSAGAAQRDALAHEVVAVEGPHTGTAVFLHGILGSGQNLRTFARKVARGAPGARCVLVDLRCHGNSPTVGAPGAPATVADCADDVARLLVDDLGLGGEGAPPLLVGHSFGGKVALTLLRHPSLSPPKQCWVLDSQPGLVPIKGPHGATPRNPNSVEAIIDTLAGLAPPFATKEDLMAQMEAAGIEVGVRHWMTTNVRRTADGQGLEWKFDISVIPHLFEDYCGRDMWDALGHGAAAAELHLVRATRNSFWARDETQARLAAQQAANPDGLIVHDVDAGHWLHAEKPQELYAIMRDHGVAEVLR